MELRQLKYFIKVAELHSFSEAARQLNITQSTISQQIRQLEEELNVELLIRDSHKVMVSDIGLAFLPQAKQTLLDAETCIESIHDVQHLNVGELRIGTTPTFSTLLRETVQQFIKLYPGIKVNIFLHSVETLMGLLDKQEIDLALSYKSHQVYPSIESHIIFDNRLALIVKSGHPLAARTSVRLADIKQYPIALPAKGMQARSAFDRMTTHAHMHFDVRLEVNDVNMLLSVVKDNSLMTFLSEATVKHFQGVTAVRLDEANTDMEGSYHVKKNVYRKKATREFLRVLKETSPYGLAIMELL